MAGDEEVQDRRGGGRQRGLALALAFLVAVSVGLLAFRAEGLYQLPLLGVAAFASFLGLCFVLFWLAGVIKFVDGDAER